MASISSSKCKVRIFGGQYPVAQSDVEDFVRAGCEHFFQPGKGGQKEGTGALGQTVSRQRARRFRTLVSYNTALSPRRK